MTTIAIPVFAGFGRACQLKAHGCIGKCLYSGVTIENEYDRRFMKVKYIFFRSYKRY